MDEVQFFIKMKQENIDYFTFECAKHARWAVSELSTVTEMMSEVGSKWTNSIDRRLFVLRVIPEEVDEYKNEAEQAWWVWTDFLQ